MERLITLWLLFLLTSVFTGMDWCCTRYQKYPWVDVVQVYDISPSAGKYPKVPSDQIMVYYAKKFTPRDYVILAKIKSADTTGFLPEEFLVDEFKKKAAEIGADAIVLLKLNHPEPESSGGVLIETGQQPSNDLGYKDHSNSTGITEVVPQPTKENNGYDEKLCIGYAIAIRSKPQDSSGKE